MRTRSLCGLVIAAIFVLGAPANAKEPGWCATYRNGGNNCGFNTYEQCMAAVSGVGGFCNRSPYAEPDKPAARKEREAEPKARRKEKEKEEVKERVGAEARAATGRCAARAGYRPAAARSQCSRRVQQSDQLPDGACAHPLGKIRSRHRGHESARL